MKLRHRIFFLSAVALVAVGVTGCQTGQNTSSGFSGTVKERGVYTTLDIPDLGLNLPATGYLQKTAFGPGETPAAVIAGYGDLNQQQMVTLELIESATGRSLFSQDYYATYGKIVMQPLPIRLSGDYDLKLRAGGTALDSYHFTVARTNHAGPLQIDLANAAAKYGHGAFAISIEGLPDSFSGYLDRLNYFILTSVTKETEATNQDLFAQRFPGKVVMQCRLDYQGRITEPKIVENTLDDDCAQAFEKALLDRSPYDKWTDAAHRDLGADYRDVQLTFYFD